MKKMMVKLLLIVAKMTSHIKFKHDILKSKNKIENIYKKIDYNCTNKINDKNLCDISILVPMYNAENTIEKCINSICNQNTKYNYEIIIVNDGSTDESLTVLEKLNKDNIRIINQANKGISYTRNILLENANGKYITFLDSDDYFEDGFIEKMLDKIIKENLQYVKCNYTKVNQYGKRIKSSNYTRETNFNDLDEYLWGAVLEKKMYQGISFPENYWFEDMINGIYILPKVKLYGIIEDSLYKYVEYKVSATKIQGKIKNYKNLDQFFLVSEIIRNYNVRNIRFDREQIKKILNELGPMLMIRTRKLDIKVRKAIFILACYEFNKIKEEYCVDNGDILVKSLINENFISWNLYCIGKRIKER